MAILDLDGGPARNPRRKRVLDALLAGTMAALVVAFFASVPYWPREWTQRAALPPIVIPNAFSVLAHAQPAPSYTLELPRDIGVVIQQRGPNGETGLIPREYAVTMVRLRSGDVVTFGSVVPSQPVGAAIAVRGTSGVTFEHGGLTVLRWSENGASYEISSRTLDAQRLAEVAARLR